MAKKQEINDWCQTCTAAPGKDSPVERAAFCRTCLRGTITMKVGKIVKPMEWSE